MAAALGLLVLAGCGGPAVAADSPEFPAGEPCAYCDGMIGEQRFGGELVTRAGEAHRFMSTECLAGFIVSGGVAAQDIRSVKVVDYSHGERLIDARTALFVRSDTRNSPNGLNLLASDQEVVAHNLHFFFGGTRLTWTEVLELVRQEWAL